MTGYEIGKVRAEQAKLVSLLKAGHSDRGGIMLAIEDWFWEELLIEKELQAQSACREESDLKSVAMSL
jgi:hypothetical protein